MTKDHTKLIVTGVIVFLLIIAGLFIGVPIYHVWQQGMKGQARLKEAESSRRILVQEAGAKKDAAKLLAEAEVERAKGVAQANQIIGEGLKGHEEYLRYLWIMSLEHTAQGDGTVIYVPTEANLPILEAGRLKK